MSKTLFEKISDWLFGWSEKKGSQRVKVTRSGFEKRQGEEKYFELKEKCNEAKEDDDYLKALKFALEALPYFERVDGREDIQVIWPLVEAFKYLPAVKKGRTELLGIKKIISSDPKLDEDWVEDVGNALEVAEMMDEILEFLEENPGFPQSELWDEFDVDGRKWAPKIDYAERVGAIEKKKEEGKNKLFAQGKPRLKQVRN
ncbi:hypothetical protein KGY79_01775 [Candidatus Bipolaricaulota bacterium]|nr:hypothetical protein [Candidatus Bipolaricaulota bacterium]